MAESELHKKLKKEAVIWLNQTGCSIVGEEISFRGDMLDVVGIKDNGIKYCIEAKATQRDLNRKRQTDFTNSYRGNFTFYYLILPEDLKPSWEWEKWGIIRVHSANDDLGHRLLARVERRAKRFESRRSFYETIEIIMAVAKRLTNQRYYEI